MRNLQLTMPSLHTSARPLNWRPTMDDELEEALAVFQIIAIALLIGVMRWMVN